MQVCEQTIDTQNDVGIRGYSPPLLILKILHDLDIRNFHIS